MYTGWGTVTTIVCGLGFFVGFINIGTGYGTGITFFVSIATIFCLHFLNADTLFDGSGEYGRKIIEINSNIKGTKIRKCFTPDLMVKLNWMMMSEMSSEQKVMDFN